MAWWLGIAIGVGVMAGHALLRVCTHWWAARWGEEKAFLLFELGGLGVRMVLVISAVLALAPVHEGAFVGTVLLLLILSMAVEVRLVVQQIDRGALGR